MTTDVLISGRLVWGHPMKAERVTDKMGAPRFQKDNVTPLMRTSFGVAVPKAGGADWKTTDWGAVFVAVATAAWPNGQHTAPTFAWKVTDGDSAVPNKSGNVPNQKQGFPGHWVIACETTFTVKCYKAGQYAETQQLMDVNAIKTGDYCRVQLTGMKGNDSTESPGIYTNPSLFELSREGELIVSTSGPSAAEAFGGAAPAPAPAAVAPAAVAPAMPVAPAAVAPAMPVAPVAPAPIAPAPDFLEGPKTYNVDGTAYAREQLLGFGWTDAQIDALS